MSATDLAHDDDVDGDDEDDDVDDDDLISFPLYSNIYTLYIM